MSSTPKTSPSVSPKATQQCAKCNKKSDNYLNDISPDELNLVVEEIEDVWEDLPPALDINKLAAQARDNPDNYWDKGKTAHKGEKSESPDSNNPFTIVTFNVQKSKDNLSLFLDQHYKNVDVVLVQEPF